MDVVAALVGLGVFLLQLIASNRSTPSVVGHVDLGPGVFVQGEGPRADAALSDWEPERTP